jgi:hypothetical protein
LTVRTIATWLYALIQTQRYLSARCCLGGVPKLWAKQIGIIVRASQTEYTPYWVSGTHYSNDNISSLEHDGNVQ